jgi:ligand-binding sensor domain-containing protein/signal transduction histidine kinase
MSSGAGCGRRLAAVCTAVVCALLTWCPPAVALNAALDVNQYLHTAWKVRDGFTRGTIRAIAQTPDGYLWLGTDLGLLRFDGVRVTPWQPPRNLRLPSDIIHGLLVSRDGTLWIATDLGLAGWKDGQLFRVDSLAGSPVGRLLEDRAGSIWMVRFTTDWTLCQLHDGRVTCRGDDGGAGAGALGLFEDRTGRLWVGTRAGLWQWNPGPPTFYPMPGEVDGIQALAETEDGSLLIARTGGIRRFASGNAVMAFPFPQTMRSALASRILRDRDGGLWVGTPTRGLAHVHEGATDTFAQIDGLSGDTITALFEDREGSIWVATTEGLDRFRQPAVVSYSAKQGLSSGRVTSVMAAADGSVWAATFDGVNRWTRGGVTVYRERGAHSIFEDSQRRVWLATLNGVGRIESGRFVRANGFPAGLTRAIVEDARKTLWMIKPDLGFFGLARGAAGVQAFARDVVKRKDLVTAVAADPVDGGLWIGFFNGGVLYLAGGEARATYDASNGLAEGRVSSLYTEPGGTVWVATDGGLSRLKNGRAATLTSSNGLPCDAVGWAIEDAARSLWLGMPCGLVRLTRTEVDAWVAAADQSDMRAAAAHRVRVTVLDHSDGVRNYVSSSYYTAPAARAVDGKLWFMSQDGLSVLDPDRLAVNSLPPPVHIEQIVADRQAFDPGAGTGEPLRLPPLIRELQIDYTALSFVAPEKVRFRYKLEGFDQDWQDAGGRRQAFYTNLPPRGYRFRVMAANNSGVWNETGAAVAFSVLPAYYQAAWFQMLVVGAVLVLATTLYQLRARHVTRQFNMRLEERVGERTRIARDLHDTLLQSFQGVLLKFQATTYLLPDRPDEARVTLERVIEQASAAITEGRDAVQGLRSSVAARSEMVLAIMTVGEGLAADHAGEDAPKFRAYVEGRPRDLVPLIAGETYRVAVEALRNAFKHARASVIELELHYDDRELRLRVRDDGCGIDANVLDGAGRPGHYGLAGMHERAALVRGRLSVWSRLGAGTEVELILPGRVAYAKSPSTPRPAAIGRHA